MSFQPIVIKAEKGKPVKIGHQMDSRAVSVDFDYSSVLPNVNDLSASLYIMRSGDDVAFQAEICTFSEGHLYWTPTEKETARRTLTVQIVIKDGLQILHDDIYRCYVDKSIDLDLGDVIADGSATRSIAEIRAIAEGASTKAVSALGAASAAVSTANSASETAASAFSTANSALSQVSSVGALASEAKQTAINGVQAAGAAADSAQTANNKADSALSQISEINDRLTVDEGTIISNEQKLIYGASRYDTPCARSASFGGYTLSGYSQDSFEAIMEAKRRGFDMVELATARTRDGHCILSRTGKVTVNGETVNAYQVSLAEIENPVLLSTYVRYCGKIGIGILLDFTAGNHNTASITEAINLLRTRRVPYIVYSASNNVFPIARTVDPTCEILYQPGEYPTVEKVKTDAKYESIRTAAAQAGGGLVTIQVSGSPQITAEYADGLAALGIGLTGSRLEVLESRQANADYYTIHIGQYRTADIYTALT
jgi:hypothetical protein